MMVLTSLNPRVQTHQGRLLMKMNCWWINENLPHASIPTFTHLPWLVINSQDSTARVATGSVFRCESIPRGAEAPPLHHWLLHPLWAVSLLNLTWGIWTLVGEVSWATAPKGCSPSMRQTHTHTHTHTHTSTDTLSDITFEHFPRALKQLFYMCCWDAINITNIVQLTGF